MAQLKSTNITGNLAVSGNVVASKIIKLGGTSDQILCADGNVVDKSSIQGTTYTGGTGISIGTGNVINHANSVTAVGTAGLYKIKYDAQGHITGTESFTLPTIPDVSGFVTGPSESTDNAVARYDGETGEVIQNSSAILDDSGNLTLNGNLEAKYLEVNYTEAGTQPSAAKILSVNNASTDHTGWRGRLVVGANNKTFLMGTYKGLCVLGAHSWSNASEGQGAAWEDMYFNPDGGAKLYFGNRGYVIDSGVIKVENPSNSSASAATAYLNIGTLGDPVWGRIAVTSDIKNGTLTMATSGTGISGSATFTANQNSASNFTVTLNSSAAGNRSANQVVLAAAAGQINSDKFAVSGSGTVKATWQYNSTTDCIELVWV